MGGKGSSKSEVIRFLLKTVSGKTGDRFCVLLSIIKLIIIEKFAAHIIGSADNKGLVGLERSIIDE